MPVRTLGPKGGGFGGGYTSIGERNECREHLVAVTHRLEKGTSAENVGSQKGVDYDVSHWLGRRTKHPL